MSWSQPTITACCDRCRRSCEEIELTETAHGWDARYVDDELRDRGWIVNDNELICEGCVEELHEMELQNET